MTLIASLSSLCSTGRTLKQGYVTLPMVEVQLEESEISHQCPLCEMFEQVEDTERFKRCAKCKKRYYVSLYDLFRETPS